MNEINEIIKMSHLSDDDFYDSFGKDRVYSFIEEAGVRPIMYFSQRELSDGVIEPAHLVYLTSTDLDSTAKKLFGRLQQRDRLIDCQCLCACEDSTAVIADIFEIGRARFDALPETACIGYTFAGANYYKRTKKDVTGLFNKGKIISL